MHCTHTLFRSAKLRSAVAARYSAFSAVRKRQGYRLRAQRQIGCFCNTTPTTAAVNASGICRKKKLRWHIHTLTYDFEGPSVRNLTSVQSLTLASDFQFRMLKNKTMLQILLMDLTDSF